MIPTKLSPADRARVTLFRLAKNDPTMVPTILDAIRTQALEALQATLATAEPKVLAELQNKITNLFDRYKRAAEKMHEEAAKKFSANLEKKIETEVAKIRRIQGLKGDSPSVEMLLALIRPLVDKMRSEIKDGHTPTRNELLELMGPLASEILSQALPNPQTVADREKALDDKMLGIVQFEIGKLITELNKNMGGGTSGDRVKAGTGVSIATDVLGVKTISVASTSASILTATGTVDDSNVTFTFAQTPLFIVKNGVSLRQGYGWSWVLGTLTATLDSAVGTGGDIYGIV